MTRGRNVIADQKGVVLVTSLLVLAMVTLMGVYAARRASVEQAIAANSKSSTVAFYMAESGLNHAKQLLATQFKEDPSNKSLIATDPTAQPVWTFALNGSMYGSSGSMHYCEGCETGDSQLDGAWTYVGVELLSRTITVGNLQYTYTVDLWDNDESNDCEAGSLLSASQLAAQDCDGKVILRATAQAFASGSSSPLAESVQEMSIDGSINGTSPMISGLSQEFSSEGKASYTGDVNEIDFSASDFSSQSI